MLTVNKTLILHKTIKYQNNTFYQQDMSKALDYMHKSVRLSMNNKDDVMKNEKDLELLIEDVQKLVEC